MKSIFNEQFDYDSNEELELILDNLNTKVALKIIEIGIEKGLNEGIYDLTEAHCLYKSIQHIKNGENSTENKQETE